jgi:acetyl esterase/lipase
LVSFLELSLKHGAVILCPDYRLRPEHEMVDGIDDLRSFWKWVEQDAAQVVSSTLPGLELDVTNLLVCGESAGGYLTVQTAILGMTSLPIKVLVAQYPVLDFKRIVTLPNVHGQDAKKLPYSLIEDHLAALEPGKICTRAKSGSRMHLVGAMLHANKFCDISGNNAWIDPMTSIETARKLPPTLLYQSKEDESVSYSSFQRKM